MWWVGVGRTFAPSARASRGLANDGLLGDARACKAAWDLLGLGDGEEFAAREKAESFAFAVLFAEGQGDLAFGVAVPEGEAAQQLAVADAGLVGVASLLDPLDDARGTERGGVEAEVEGPGRAVVEGDALAEAARGDRDGDAIDHEGLHADDGRPVDEAAGG